MRDDDFTIQAQLSIDGGATWTALREAENFDHTNPDITVEDIAVSLNWIAEDFEADDLPQGALWRIAAWRGLDADTTTQAHFWNGPWDGPGQEVMTPAQVAEQSLLDLSYAFGRDLTPPGLLKELGDIRDMLTDLARRRDAAIRMLMKTDTKRKRIAEASGLKEARLYQIVNEGKATTTP
jgi:hypothetical protein